MPLNKESKNIVYLSEMTFTYKVRLTYPMTVLEIKRRKENHLEFAQKNKHKISTFWDSVM